VQRQTGVTTVVVTHDQEEAVMLADRIALMFDGRIAHYAAPIDLFQRPRSMRAARFFGGRNFLPAVREGTIARTDLGDFELDPRCADLMPEGPATLTIRPEHLAIGTASSAAGVSGAAGTAGNTLSGQLTSCIFQGTHTRCIVRAGTYEFEALKSVDSNMLGEGGQLSLRLPPEHIWLLPGDSVY
jgi:ABC-type Fe3+/spermidine/putrescine transport system ATPase subunit